MLPGEALPGSLHTYHLGALYLGGKALADETSLQALPRRPKQRCLSDKAVYIYAFRSSWRADLLFDFPRQAPAFPQGPRRVLPSAPMFSSAGRMRLLLMITRSLSSLHDECKTLFCLCRRVPVSCLCFSLVYPMFRIVKPFLRTLAYVRT